MLNSQSTTPAPPDKPAKPYPDFPLFPHATRRWAKTIRGQLHYFGACHDGPDAVLAKYLEQKDALPAGRKPREVSACVTIKDLCNQFLNHKKQLLDAGEITSRTWGEHKAICDLLVSHLGKLRLV